MRMDRWVELFLGWRNLWNYHSCGDVLLEVLSFMRGCAARGWASGAGMWDDALPDQEEEKVEEGLREHHPWERGSWLQEGN
jgi:hypothetical protein